MSDDAVSEAREWAQTHPLHTGATVAIGGLIAEIERLRELLYEPPKGPGVSPVVLYRTKEGHLVGQALQREEDAHLDTLARAMRAETEVVAWRSRCEAAEAAAYRMDHELADHLLDLQRRAGIADDLADVLASVLPYLQLIEGIDDEDRGDLRAVIELVDETLDAAAASGVSEQAET